MKCIFTDFRRAMTGRWFLAALLASAAALYMSIGSQTHYLLTELRYLSEYDAIYYDLCELLMQGMRGDFGVLTLPALSALPFAAQALTELKCGAIRPVIFRAGRKSWIAGKLAGCLLSGMLLHAASAGLLALALNLLVWRHGAQLPLGEWAELLPLLLRRMLCGGVWACVGCVLALLTETAAAAYLAPLCLCYAMVMISTRFFPDAALLNPTNWLTGPLLPTVVFLILTAAAVLLVLQREVNRHA